MKSQTKVVVLFSTITMCVEAQTEIHEQVVFGEHASSKHIKFISSRNYDIESVVINDYLTPTKLYVIVPMCLGKTEIKLAPQAFSWMNVPNTEVALEFRGVGRKKGFESHTDFTKMFYNSSSLVSVDFAGFSHKPFIKNMTAMFKGCSKLKEIVWGDLNTSNVTAMECMFSGCSSIEKIDLSHFKTSKVETMNHMFSSCHKLKSLDLSRFDTKNVTDVDGMLKNCYALESINMCLFKPSLMHQIDQMSRDARRQGLLRRLDHPDEVL